MKNKGIFIALVVAVGLCAVHLYSYRKELGLYWREWSSFQRHLIIFHSQLQLRQPILSRSVSKQDPEAAAIAEFVYQNYADTYRKNYFHHIETLSQLSLRYPRNPYFLYDLACRLMDEAYTDPKMIHCIANRLLEIDPNNGRYYFLKAYAELKDWTDTRVEDALVHLDKGFSCPALYDPYELYRDRTCSIVDKDGMTAMLSGLTKEWKSRDGWILRQFRAELLSYTQDLIINSQHEKAMQIHDQLQQIAEKSLKYKIDWIDQPLMALSYYNLPSMPDQIPQGVELKWMTSDKGRFRQNRMQLLAWMQWDKRYREARDNSIKHSRQDDEYPAWKKTSIPQAAHSFQMTVALFLVFLFFGTVGAVWKMQPSRFSRWAVIIAVLSTISYLLVCRWADYQQLRHSLEMCDHYTFEYLPSSLVQSIAMYAVNHFIPPKTAIWVSIFVLGLLMWLWLKKEQTFGWFRKLLIRLLVIIAILVLWSGFNGLKFGLFGFDILVCIFLLPVLCYRRKDRKAGIYYGLLSRSPESMQYRWRCFILCGVMLIVHAVTFSIFVGPLLNFTVYSINGKNSYLDYIGTKITLPEYRVDPNDYTLLLEEFKTEKTLYMSLTNKLIMVEPEDIPKVLETIRQRRQNDPNSSYLREMGMAGMPIAGTIFDPNFDRLPNELWTVSDYCGRDALSYIKPFLTDPRAINSVALRECSIPHINPNALIELWQQKYMDWQTDPNHIKDIGCQYICYFQTIAKICPYPYSPLGDYSFAKVKTPESERKLGDFSNYLLERNPWYSSRNNPMLFLNSQQKGQAITAAAKLFSEKPFDRLGARDILSCHIDLDAALRDRLWKEQLSDPEKRSMIYEYQFQTLQNQPWDCHISDSVLQECVTHDNASVRTMGQHISRKLGRIQDRQTLERWAADSNPAIRANLVLFAPDSARGDDPSPLVQLMFALRKN